MSACIGAGLVGGEGFAVDASLIVADANKQRSMPGAQWNRELDAEAVNRATKECLATLNDAAFGAASDVMPKFVFLILRDCTLGVSSFELLLGAGSIFLVILPIGPLSWLAVTGLSLYILVSADVSTSRRGAFILLAATVPMLWGRWLFSFFANSILAADASLVSWLLGTHRTGNLVEFADNSGQLVIFPPCSSIANVTLAFLCWVTFSQLVVRIGLRLFMVSSRLRCSGCSECFANDHPRAK